MDVWQGKKAGTPEEARIMKAFEAANIHPVGLLHTGEYEMTQLRTFWDSYLRGSFKNELQHTIDTIKKGGWEGTKEALTFMPSQVARLMQTIAQPLFQYVIPRMKLTSMVRDMEQYLYHNPHATPEQLQRVAAKISDHIDNAMGEAVRDNLGMNKTIADAGYLTLRSFAWTVLGPGRGVTGGALSMGRGLAEGVLKRDLGKTEWRISPKSANYDPRIGYSLAFPLTVAMIGGTLTFLRTGKPPNDWRDFLMPLTGGTVKGFGGKQVPERERIPGYQKDFLGYAFHPGLESIRQTGRALAADDRTGDEPGLAQPADRAAESHHGRTIEISSWSWPQKVHADRCPANAAGPAERHQDHRTRTIVGLRSSRQNLCGPEGSG